MRPPEIQRKLQSSHREDGFALAEVVFGLTIFLIVATALGGLLASSMWTYGASRERTLGTELAMQQLEVIRRMPYDSIGVANGNPPGTIQATKSITVTGIKATMTVQVRYVDDQTPNSYRTYANYKQVTVTITRDRDSKRLAREVTFISPATRASSSDTVIKASVLDLNKLTPVADTTVNLTTGPSAPRTEVTDAGGNAIFPGLTANPTSGAQAFYDLVLTPPTGYQTFADDRSPNTNAHMQLGISAQPAPVLRVYKPSTINVSTPSPVAPAGSAVPYTISVGSERGAQAFAQAAGTTFLGVSSITAGLLDAEPILPLPSPTLNIQYLAGASAVSGTSYYYSTAVTQPVPSAYPTTLTQGFNLAAGTWYTASQVKPLTVKVQTGTTPVNGAAVAVSGGPGTSPGIYVAGVTSTSSTASTLSSGTISSPAGSGASSGTISPPGGANYSSGTISTGTSYTSGAITSHSWSSGNWYTSISANCSSQTSGNCNSTPAAGTIADASFSFGSAIGSGSSYSVTLYKNGASAGVSCNIAAGQPSCTISGANVSVNGSDTVVLVVNRTSGSGTSYTGTGTGTAATSAAWSNGTWYTSVSANCASQTSGNCNTTPSAGTITGASFSFGSAIGSSSSYSVTLYKNGATTGASCAIGNSQTGCTISGASVSVNGSSDKIVLVVSRTSGSGTSYTGTGSATATAGGSWSSGNWYTSLSANCTSQTVGSCNTTPAAGTITSATFSFASAISSSTAYSVTLYKNGASTGSSCTVGNSQTSCTISGLSLAVSGTDTVVLVVNRTSGTSYTGTASTSYTTLGSWSTGNWYVSVSASCASQTAGNCNTTPPAGTITSASLSFASAIGGSSSYSVTLYKNGVSTGSSCTVAAGQTGCTINGTSVSVNGSSDTVVLVVARTSGTGTSYSGTLSASAGHSTPPAAGQITFNVPSGSGYTITAWGANTSAQLTGQSVTTATTKTLPVS